MAEKIDARRFLGAVLALLALLAFVAIAPACEEQAPPGPTQPLDAWHEALSRASVEPARVVVISDSMGEISLGYEDVWKAFHESVTHAPMGTWFPPRRFNGSFGWEHLPGEPAEIGLEGRGQLLREGDGPAGRTAPVLAPTTMDLYYTARPDGAPLEVGVDGVTLATVDTSRDESGRPVTGEVKAQRWRSPFLGRKVAWQLEVSGPGVAAIETVHFPPSAGIEVHGTGLSGAATSQFLERGYAIAHIEAMVARGEAPDLVVWGADTADSQDMGAQFAALVQAFEGTRGVAPSASIAHYIPTGHNSRSDWDSWAAGYRTVDLHNDVAVIDGFEALGDVSKGAPNAHLAADGVHLNGVGQSEMDKAWIAALAPGPLAVLSPGAHWHRALAETDARAAQVVLFADEVGERSGGFETVWDELDGGSGGGWWSPPGSSGAPRRWDLVDGEAAAIGIDGAGLSMVSGDAPSGMSVPVPVPTTLDVYYAARPDGAPVEVRVDGAVVGTIDTSLDEFGEPVASDLPSQRWRSPSIAATVSWELEVTGPGTAAVEAVAAPPATGIALHGTGREGASTRELVESGAATGFLRAMVARGEAPDLVVWAADTAPTDDLATMVASLDTALVSTRILVPGTTQVHYLPPAHDGRSDWPVLHSLLRGVATGNRADVVDAARALGDISTGAANAHYSLDGRNLSAEGQAVLHQAFVSALSPS